MIYNTLYTTLGSQLRGWLVNRLKGGTGRIDFEDLMQATWLNVWRGLDTFASRSEGQGTAVGRLKTWVYTVARNLHLDAERHEATIRMDSLEALTRTRMITGEEHIEYYDKECEPDIADRVTERAEADWVAGMISTALLPQQVMLLQLVGTGMTQDEIGEVYGMPRTVVKSRLHRARQAAYRYLASDDKRVRSAVFDRRYTRRDAATKYLLDTTLPS